jgi:hypothetical protein
MGMSDKKRQKLENLKPAHTLEIPRELKYTVQQVAQGAYV